MEQDAVDNVAMGLAGRSLADLRQGYASRLFVFYLADHYECVDLQALRRDTLLFDPKEFGTIFAFVDFGNVRYWAKSFWPDDNRERLMREIDIEKIAHAIDMVGATERFFYYGHYEARRNLSPENPLRVQYQNSVFRIDKAKKAGFKVSTKEIKVIETYDEAGRKRGQTHKCNFDVEITMDMVKQLARYDTVFLWSGDSDFRPLLAYLRRKGKKIVTLCARDSASSEIKKVSSLFIPADRLKAQLELAPYKNGARLGHFESPPGSAGEAVEV